MTAHTPWDPLAGQYTLRPGHKPAIRGQRPILADGQWARLLRGKPVQALAPTLASVFTLCAHAHRHCAQSALNAALGHNDVPRHSDALLCLETTRDHLRAIALEWPQRLLGQTPPDLHWLSHCPVPLASASAPSPEAARERLQALARWLADSVLQQPLESWLAQCQDPDRFLQWCQEQAGRLPPARALAAARALHALPALPLRVLAPGTEHGMRALAHAMWHQPGFCEQPTWDGACAETGPWARWRHTPPHTVSAWSRLAARWVEVVHMAHHATQAPPAPLLAHGALALGPGQGMAWCEMARGLLVHTLALDGQTVQDYRVLAPTEWNFHPDGSLGQALQALNPQDSAPAQLLAAAFDPCVACAV